MLGEAAYTAHDAERYAQSYRDALAAIAAAHPKDGKSIFERPSISVKLSALHPRYEWIKRERVMGELLPIVVALGEQARANDLALTIDAEESERLDLMLDMFEALGEAPTLQGLERPRPCGAGLSEARAAGDRTGWSIWRAARTGAFPVRLVKGAYWDTEIKRAQEQGLADYPVFTRKAATDTSYLACARAMLAAGDAIYPQFATHNAHTVAAIDTLAGNAPISNISACMAWARRCTSSIATSARASARASMRRSAAMRICSPIWCAACWRTARTRRSSTGSPTTKRRSTTSSPIRSTQLSKDTPLRNPRIPLPADMLPGRKNSAGFVWSDPAKSEPMIAAMKQVAGDAADRRPDRVGAKRPARTSTTCSIRPTARALDRQGRRSLRSRCQQRARCRIRARSTIGTR